MPDAFWVKTPLKTVVDELLHKSVQQSDEDSRRHSQFMIVHLLVGIVALTSLPLLILLAPTTEGALSQTLAILPFWTLMPIVPVGYLSRTGNLENAFLLTAALSAVFITWIASLTGGLSSPHLIWLAVVPLEVALSGKGKVIKSAAMICVAALILLALSNLIGMLQSPALGTDANSKISTVSVILAVLYASFLAMRIEWLHRGRIGMMQAEEMRYRSLADTISDMITRHDRSGDVTFVSPAASELVETNPSKMLGNGLFHQIHIPDRPAYLHALSDCMNGQAEDAAPVCIELRVMTAPSEDRDNRTGSILRWVEMKCAPELDKNGTVIGAISVTRDISKRKVQQLDLEEARQEAEKANESKTRFLANVTHELRTPLNTIIGFSEILFHPELSQNNEERNREYAELIHKSGNHLLQLVNALLDMSRIESGNFEVNPQHFDMGDLAQSCCKMMQADADQRGITLFSECDASVSDMHVDPRACRQILLNLVSNALKFSDKGDQVSISLAWAKQGGRRLDDQIELTVSDTGIGIDAKDIDKLGEPFVQAESSLQRRYEGAGIGLSIVRGLTELQNGKMSIDSKLGKGTSVTITLPVDMETTSKLADTKEPTSIATMNSSEAEQASDETKRPDSKVA